MRIVRDFWIERGEADKKKGYGHHLFFLFYPSLLSSLKKQLNIRMNSRYRTVDEKSSWWSVLPTGIPSELLRLQPYSLTISPIF